MWKANEWKSWEFWILKQCFEFVPLHVKYLLFHAYLFDKRLIGPMNSLNFKWISRFNIITTSNTKHWENFKYNAICFIMKMYYFVALKYMIYLPLNQLQHLHLNFLATIKEHQVKTIRYCEYWGLMSRRQKILKISETRFPL